MDAERWRRVQAAFEGAIERAGAERAAFVAVACAEDLELRFEVERLLLLDDSLEELEPFSTLASHSDSLVQSLREPERIGPYRIVRVLGEGGLGTVYLAEQEQPIRRRVALKVVRLGMETPSVLARFDLERQALARMDHPNIARILDAGDTPCGQPYFVMEYIDGVPITAHCDAARLDVRQRLELFESVCRAVEHAHQRGILHRDLKPSNVLVRYQDGIAVPVIIDFGLAKAMRPSSEAPTLTLHGQVVGTLPYMSPEQIAEEPVELDARADVYSLGTLLYELAVGAAPVARVPGEPLFDYVERARAQGPTPVHDRFAQLGERTEAIVRARRTSSARLLEALRGDVGQILAKALARARERRYTSAAALAADVRRSLRHEPLLAAHGGAGYRLQRFLRRNRWSLGAFAAVCLAWFAASALSAQWHVRADDDRAEKAAIVRACQTLQLAVADAHLWLEEALADDATVEPEHVLPRLGAATTWVDAALSGGDSALGVLEPVNVPEARAALTRLRDDLALFERIARRRWASRGIGAPGGVLDQECDEVYRRILDESVTASRALDAAIDAEFDRSMTLGNAVNLLAMLLIAAPLALLLRLTAERRGRGAWR